MHFRFALAVLASTVFLASPAVAAGKSDAFPLDSLSAAEIELANSVLKRDARFPKDGLFVSMDAIEPSKAEVNNYRPGTPFSRHVQAIVLSRAQKKSYEVLLDLAGGKIETWTPLVGTQPMVLVDEYERANEAVKADPRFAAALKKRGINDVKETWLDGWAAGSAFGSDRRVMRALVFYKGRNTNYYGRPVEGIQALVDLNTKEVIMIRDTGVVPVPEKNQDFTPEAIGPQRQAPKPLVATMPEGVSFEVNGQEVRWQGWRFRFSFHQREGLVLHTVGYEDKGRVRPILYRAGLAEMIVPYGDPDPNWNWRSAFDVGEYGFGNLSSPLDAGKDVPAEAKLFDATFSDTTGKPYAFPRAVGLYERDGGVLWKHYDYITGTNSIRRARELVLTTSAAVGNYDYILNWVFHQDGTLEMDAVATGILLVKGTAQETSDGKVCAGCTGHLVDRRTLAPNHQHFMNFRLDFDVDGEKNTVSEMDQTALAAGPENPMGNGFQMVETPLVNEADAQRDLNPLTNRMWRVFNPSTRNALGNTTGYALMPGPSTLPFVHPGSTSRQRASFLDHQLWVTRFRPEERYAAGMYPNQAAGDRGLSLWSADHENIDNQDVVMWYTMGLSHAPREEEWPMMNATHLGFKLIPAGFFARNPAMDVPPTP